MEGQKTGKKKIKIYKQRIKVGQIETSEIARLTSQYENIDTTTIKTFKDFPLSKKTLSGLNESGYSVPTEIQKESIGLALKRLDILGAAKTGSGKTIAFLVPVLEILFTERWNPMDGLGALIITPTRELAYQIFDTLRNVGRHHGFSAGLIIGGKDLKFEQKRLQGCNVMVCTPGRLLQHMNENPLMDTTNLQILVIDEADRCLDLGFQKTMNGIIENLPPKRQTLLFSATQTKSVKDLARLSLKDPVYVSVHENAKYSTPEALKQSYIICELHHKLDVLWSFVTTHKKSKVLVFLTSCKQVRFVYSIFCRMRPGNSLMQLHGGMHQLKRMTAYDEYCRKEHAVLFATDVAARGLDFPAVDWVVQLDCPEDANAYIHRAGRTARYTQSGESLLIITPEEEEGMMKRLEDKKIPISKIEVNPKKLTSVQRKLEAILAKDVEMKQMAQRAFVTYIKSVYLMKDKEVFDVNKIDLEAFARSMGLAVAPRVRFLKRKELLPRLPAATTPDDQPIAELEDAIQTNFELPKKTFDFGVGDTDDEIDDIMVVKRRNHDLMDVPEIPLDMEKKKKNKIITKESAAKKILKKNLKTNVKMTFDEEGNAKFDATRHKMTDAAREYEESALAADTPGGINIEKARQVLLEEDKADKQMFKEKIKARHREQRLKDKEERRRIARAKKNESSEAEEESDDIYTSEIIDSLPDPDKIYGRNSESESDNEEDVSQSKKRNKRRASDSDDVSIGQQKTKSSKKLKKKNEDISLVNYEELALKFLES
ncbi:probable ATP-dependent RNA helicase DDX10 [Artemia franciscana]|uniref:probable ATP-dependent RNA helicase DDX10 n=1 Tax=Artemia franciscana TaxID=6661 RepID=UPI0032DB36EA